MQRRTLDGSPCPRCRRRHVPIHRGSFVRGDAIEDATDEALRRADHALIGVAGERTLEQEQVGAVHQGTLEPAIDLAFDRVGLVVQRSAVRGVDADDMTGTLAHADKGAGLGAVATSRRVHSAR